MTEDAQRLQALKIANSVRQARADLKRRITSGRLTAAEIILQPPREANGLAIGDLLASQRGWGPARCRRFLTRNQIAETRPIGALTDRQRHYLAAQLDRFRS
jgi:hypothetical protein